MMIEDERDAHLAGYVVRYYGHLMNQKEHLAFRHLAGTIKATHGRSDTIAQQEAKSSKTHLRELLSDDPEVLRLANRGMAAFQQQIATRILAEHGDKIILNRCPKCGALARTPNARQCASCHHDWHHAGE